MRIGTPQTHYQRGHVRLWAPVSLEQKMATLPETFVLWYDVPEDYGDALATRRADGFVVALLFLAIWLREDINVQAPLSPHLAHGLREYQRIFEAWFPQAEPINISCEGYEAPGPATCRDATACFFSGGVDSFFTLRSHLPSQEPHPGYALTHGLFIHGFDIALEDEVAFQEAFRKYEGLFDDLGLALIPVRTNLKHFINSRTCGWRAAHGAFLISVPLILGRLLSTCYVPGTHTYQHDVPNGSHPLVDPLLSTETLQIVHDGAWATRMEKTETLASWPATHDHLYVCFGRSERPFENCCRCEKCIRTMTALELTGALEHYTTFPLPLRRKDIRGCPLYYETAKGWMQELIDYAEAIGRNDIARDVRWALFRLWLRLSPPGRLARRAVRRLKRHSSFAERLLQPLRRL